MAIKIAGNQISDNAIATALIAANAVTPAKAALDSVWAFTALPTVNVDPSSSNDLVRKNYVDGLLQGLSWKKACKVRMTSNVNLSSPGATLDSQSMSSGDRFLCTAQTTDTENGIYVYNGAASAATRATDADPYTELDGAAVFVTLGTSADQAFTQTATLSSFASQTWTQFSGAGQIIAGDGLAKSGNTLSVNVDNSGIELNSDSLRLKDAGVTAAKLAGAVAGNGLSGGAGSALAVNVDDASIEINSDALRLKDGGIATAKLADAAVTAAKLSSAVAGNGLAGGAGTALSVNAGAGLALDSDNVVLSLNGLSAAAVDVANDSIAIIDATDNSSKKESIVDLVAGMASTGLSAGSGALSLNLNGLSSATVDLGADSIAIIDATDNSSKKESIADIMTAAAGNALTASSGVLAVGVDDATIEINSDALRLKDGGIGAAKLASNACTTAKIQDGNVTLDKLENLNDGRLLVGSAGNRPAAVALSGDATLANSGALTIAANAINASKLAGASVETAKIADNAVTLAKTGWLPYFESFNGTTATKYDLGRAVESTHFAGVKVYRNGLRCKKVASSPSDQDEYTVANDGTGSVCAITFGAAPNGSTIMIDYIA